MHPIGYESRQDNLRGSVKFPERRKVKVIKVAMREVNGVDFKQVRSYLDRLGKMPPRSPIARPNKPRIDKQTSTVRFHEHASVTQYRERKRHEFCKSYNRAVTAASPLALRRDDSDNLHATSTWTMVHVACEMNIFRTGKPTLRRRSGLLHCEGSIRGGHA